MRVVFFTHTFAPDYTGGAEVSLYHTCRGLQQRGVDCVVLTVNNQRSLRTSAQSKQARDQWYAVDGIPVHRLQLPPRFRNGWTDLFDPRVFGLVRRELKQLQPDLLHVHNVAQATLAPFVGAWAAGVPTVCTLHDHWLLCPNNMLLRADGASCNLAASPQGCRQCYRQNELWGDVPNRRRTTAWLTRSVARFIAPSQALIDLHLAAGYAASRLRLVPNALAEPPMIPPSHAGVQQAIAQAQGRPTLVFGGGGVAIKGADLLLRAIPDLLVALPDLQLIIAGGGKPSYYEQYARFAPRVVGLGMVPFNDMRALFAAADLTLLPSIWQENSPMTIYENYQVGTPVLASNIGGSPELIDEGATGYLFTPNVADELVAKVAQHFARPAHERRRMRQACLVKARTQLTLAHHLDLLQQVYAEIIDPQTVYGAAANVQAAEAATTLPLPRGATV